jgi:uncharacterized protein
MTVSAIDVWAQPAPGSAFRSPMFASLVKSARAGDRVALAGSPDRITAAMTEAGVAKALLSAWYLQDGCMISNQQIAEMVAQFPERLVGVASVSLDDPNAARTLEDNVKNHGFKALRIIPWVWNRPPNHVSYRPLFKKMHRAWHPVLHAGRPYRSPHAIGARASNSLCRRSCLGVS